MRDRFKKIEGELEKLSVRMVEVLKEHKRKGIIGEEEYKKHAKCKKDFLTYLDNKRTDNK